MSGIAAVFDTMAKDIPAWPNLQRTCKLMYQPSYTYTASGLKIGPNSSAPNDSKRLFPLYSTPEPAWQILSEQDLLLVHCLFALKDRNLGIIESNFVSNVYNFFTRIERDWDILVASIHSGTLPPGLSIEPAVQQAIEQHLQPDPARASELEQISAGSNLTGRARRIWPHLHTVLSVDTGAFAIYSERLQKEWLAAEKPIEVADYPAERTN